MSEETISLPQGVSFPGKKLQKFIQLYECITTASLNKGANLETITSFSVKSTEFPKGTQSKFLRLRQISRKTQIWTIKHWFLVKLPLCNCVVRCEK